MKHYYKTIDFVGNHLVVEIWHGSSKNTAWLYTTKKFVLPLGVFKPRNVPRETIKEF